MPIITDHDQVLDLYAEANHRKWVLASFNVENLTTIEAILDSVNEHGNIIGFNNLPIIIGITNNYRYRPQTLFYTHTRRWEIGLQLFLSDLNVLVSNQSPYAKLRVMIHLDHIQWDQDRDLLGSDLNQFSSIMYDASMLPFNENIKKTSNFVGRNGDKIIIEGACDEILESSNLNNKEGLTVPLKAEDYYISTGVDLIVPNLGTEHRSASSRLQYHGKLAREITKRIGPHICLHGTSSISLHNIKNLFDDGIRKVNIWTILERDSSFALFSDMVKNAAKLVGAKKAKELLHDKVLGRNADCISDLAIDYFTTTYRQGIIFQRMKKIIGKYLAALYS